MWPGGPGLLPPQVCGLRGHLATGIGLNGAAVGSRQCRLSWSFPGKLLSYQNYLIILVNYLVKLGRRVDVGRKALPFSGWLPTQHIS